MIRRLNPIWSSWFESREKLKEHKEVIKENKMKKQKKPKPGKGKC